MMARSRRAGDEFPVGGDKGVVVYQNPVRFLGRRSSQRVELHLLAGDVHDHVADDIRRTAKDGLQTDRVERVAEAIPETPHVAFARVHFNPVVIRVKNLIAIEIDGARSILIDLQGVGVAGNTVMTNDVPRPIHDDTVIARVRGAVASIGEGPCQAALQDVVRNVIVLLVRAAMNPQGCVVNVNAPDNIALRAAGLKANGAKRSPDRQSFDVHVAPIDLDYIAVGAIPAVEDGVLLARAADDDRILRRARSEDVKKTDGIDAVRELNDVARLSRRYSREERS